MGFQIPELIKIELCRAFEGVFNRRRIDRYSFGEGLKIFMGLLLSCGLIALVLVFTMGRSTEPEWTSPEQSWFYDQNTGELFKGQWSELGPIEAPSGPNKKGEPAGIRAHVYSYAVQPEDADLFVGFLERPDPAYRDKKSLTADVKDYPQWARGRLVKRPEDKQWVSAASAEGHGIVRGIIQPNAKGQTPIYQLP